MSDLIRRSDLLALYEGCEGLKVPVEVVIQNIKDMPTAYDVDKVVEQLEERKREMIAENDIYVSHAIYEEAIDIVKEGGVDDYE